MRKTKTRSFAIETQLSDLLTSAARGEGVQPGKLVNRALREYLIAKGETFDEKIPTVEQLVPEAVKLEQESIASRRKKMRFNLDPKLIGEEVFSNSELQRMRNEGMLILSYGRAEVPKTLRKYKVAIMDINVHNPKD